MTVYLISNIKVSIALSFENKINNFSTHYALADLNYLTNFNKLLSTKIIGFAFQV